MWWTCTPNNTGILGSNKVSVRKPPDSCGEEDGGNEKPLISKHIISEFLFPGEDNKNAPGIENNSEDAYSGQSPRKEVADSEKYFSKQDATGCEYAFHGEEDIGQEVLKTKVIPDLDEPLPIE